MKEESIENFFQLASKVIIFIAVIVMILGLMMKFSQKSKKTLVFPSVTITPSLTEKSFLSKINLDLKGPLICKNKTKQASISAFVKNKQLRIVYEDKNKKNNFLLLKDCLYQWQEGKYSGERICGINPFLSMIEALSSFRGLTKGGLFNQLFKLFPQSPIATDEAAILTLIDSCKKKDFNENVFEAPENVLFKNKDLR